MKEQNRRSRKKWNFLSLIIIGILPILLVSCKISDTTPEDSDDNIVSIIPPSEHPNESPTTTFEHGIYKIVNKSTGRSLNMVLSGMVDGSTVQQYQEADTMEFLWKVDKVGEYYSIQSLLTPRTMCVRRNSDENGAVIEVRVPDTNENLAQLWTLKNYKDAVQIISAKSGLTMGLLENSIKTSNLPQLLEFEDVDWQLWQFEKVELGEALPSLLPVDGALFNSSTPEIVKYNDTYYMYIMAPHISIKASQDLINWEQIGTVFPGGDPSWLNEEVPGYGIWAPGVYKIKDKYYLYYCISTIGTQNSAIGVAVNTTLDHNSPDYRWVDKGMVIRSKPGDDYNCIDPNIFTDDSGDVWLTFGSYWNGIHQRQINSDTGLLLEENTETYHIAQRFINYGAIEAPYLIKRGEYYYLFTAFNSMDNTYHNRVSRSTSVHGPFYDKDGKASLKGGGTQITQSLSGLFMPGHASVFLDADGQYYLVGEYFRKDSPSIMFISTILWDDEGWPVTALTPNISKTLAK